MFKPLFTVPSYSVTRVIRVIQILKVFLAVIVTAGACVYLLIDYLPSAFYPNAKSLEPNCFQPEENGSRAAALTGKFIVNQKHCKIPEVKLWSMEVTREFRVYSPPECLYGSKGHIPGFTFVSNNSLVINTALVKSLEMKLYQLECCYQEILPYPEGINDFDFEYFLKKGVSETCNVINGTSIVPPVNALEVTCFYLPGRGGPAQIHRDFHILANVLPGDAKLAKKIKYWKDKEDLPPNVYILGLDCGSRLNIRRQMPVTVKYLQRLGASEMLGYTKVGPHTGCNLRPMLTSFTLEELENICNYTTGRFVDSCPWIFYNYSNANYVTSFLEDGTSLKAERDGFQKPPTDFYHVIWARYIHGISKNKYDICMEKKTIHEVMIDFNENLARNMGDLGLPYFSFTWISYLAHDDFNGYQYIDKYFRDSLRRLNSSGYLDNTVVILVGDHGYRWFRIRRSVPGWYEDKQPVLWLGLPPKVTQQWPHLKTGLEYNSNKLSSPFDVHQTLQHILSLTTGRPLKTFPIGMSLFRKLKDRNCSEAGIPLGYCVCTVLLPFRDIQRPFLHKAKDSAFHSNFSVDSLPKDKNCEKLKILGIIGAAVTSDSYQDNLTDDQLESLVTSGKSNLILSVATSVFKERPILEFILKYVNNSTVSFQNLYAFDVDSTNGEKLAVLGYHRCLTIVEKILDV